MKFKKLFNKSNRRKPRANTFVLESLEPRLLLSATPMTAAVVTTDHLDYAPGETAVITTANTNGDGLQFGAGELVRFDVSRTDGMADAASTTAGVGPAGNEAWYVTDGVGGFTAHLGSDVSGDGVADWIAPDNDNTINSSISTSWFVEEQYRNSSLVVTAAGQESGAVATHAFTDAGTNTTTVLTATSATTVYGTRLDFTATVTAAAGTVDPTGSVEFFVDGISLGVETAFSGGAADGVVQFKTNLFAFQLTAGVHSVHAVFAGTAGSFNDSTSANISHQVTQKHITGRFTADLSKVYDGTTVATGTATLNNVELIDVGNVSLVGAANFDTANVGIKKAVTFTGGVLTGSAAGNYILDSVRGDLADITPATVTVSNYTGAYDGLAHGATIAGAPGEDLSGSLIMAKHTNVGTFTEGWTFSNANYVAASGTNTITITKANATIVASGYNGVYDGAAHTATLTATGVLGESLSGLVLNVAPHSNVGTYSDGWTFTDSTGNYNSTSGSVVSNITAKAIGHAIGNTSHVYGDTVNLAATLGATFLTGVNGETLGLAYSSTGNSATANVGSYAITGSVSNGTGLASNYTVALADGTLTVGAKAISHTIGNTSHVYGDTVNLAATLGATFLTGVNGETLGLAYSSTGNSATATVGSYAITGSVSDGTGLASNYTVTLTDGTLTVGAKAISHTIGNTSHVYGGTVNLAAALGATFLTGVNGETLGLAYSSVGNSATANVGSYAITGSISDGTGLASNYTVTLTDGALTVTKATVIITGNGLNGSGYFGTYDGAAHAATATVTGLGGAVLGQLVSNTTHTNAGTYSDTLTYTDGTGNYNNASKVVKSYITKATVTLTGAGLNGSGYFGTYDGAAHAATVTVTGVGGVIIGPVTSLTTHTNAGTYSDTVTFLGDANYKAASKVVTSYIQKASVTLTGNGLNGSGYFGIYDGAAHAATATVTGVGGAVVGQLVSGTTHTNAGTYSDTVTYTDGTGNYNNASKVVKSYITKAAVTLTGAGLNGRGYFGTYDGQAHAATVTVTGAGGAIVGQLTSSTTHTNAGTYSDTVTFLGDANYKAASKVVTSYIQKASVTLTGNGLNGSGYFGTYDGQAHAATATVTGVGGVVLGQVTSGTTHTNAGIYSDTVTFLGDANYKAASKVVKSYIV